MSEGRIKDTELSAIAAAIRQKNGTNTTYKPGQMAAAIQAIPTGITPTGTVNITQNGTTDVTQYASASVSVPNSYAAGDEGKVVSNGALVAQGSDTVTNNGVMDTTLISSLTVNVSGGGQSWQPLTPTDLGAGSYIGSNNCLAIGSADWPTYHAIYLDLQALPGRLIHIDNSANNRNFWGIFGDLGSGAPIYYPPERQIQSGGKFTFHTDFFATKGRYFVYDYTSSSQNPPTVYVMDATPPST